MDITSRVLRRYAYTADARKVEPFLDQLGNALHALIAGLSKGEDPMQGKMFQNYSVAIDAFREVMYFMRANKAEHLVSRLRVLPAMSKAPFAADEVVGSFGKSVFQDAMGDAHRLQMEFDSVRAGWL